MRARTIAIAALLLANLGRDAAAAETCGDGLDNDSDSLADEGCFPGGGVTEDPLSEALTGTIAPKLGSVVYALPADLDPHVAYGVPIPFQRTYMSFYKPGTAAGYRNPFGNMWQHPYMSWLDKNTTPTPDTVIVHLPSGREVLFQHTSTSGGYDNYTPQVGAHAKFLRQSTSSPFKWELRTLTGETYVYDWSSPTGKLIELRDSLATPNVTTVSYDGSGRVQYVTDAQGTKRLKFTYDAGSKISKVEYQTISGGTPTTRAYADYTITSSQLTAYKPAGSTAQTYTYSSSKLTLIEDSAGNDLISYSYRTGTSPTAVARLKTSHGEIGFEYSSSRAACSAGTVEFFNRKGTTACDSDSDCGAGLLCGGQTDPASANTGVCYRAARCLQLTSPSEDLVTTVAPLGPTGESCEGACTDVAEYAWFTSGAVDLKGVKDPNSKWTSMTYNGDGLPMTIVYADSDNDASNGGGARTMFLFYGNSSFPGRVTETRRQSDVGTGTCSDSVTTGCQQTLYTYSNDGLLATREEKGFTLNSSGTATPFDLTTTFSHDNKGRLTQIDGPLSGANDITDFTFWTSSDVFKDGHRKEMKRKKDATGYLITTLDDYDYWGNAKSVQVPDATFTCMTFHADRNYLTQVREAMNAQTSCASTHSSDLVTNYTRDTALRLTKIEYPAGGCTHYEYDTFGRLIRTKMRDDCNPASSGDNQAYTYDDDGLLIKTESLDPSGVVKQRQEQTYFDSRRLATIINPVDTSKSASITYNSRGFVDTVEAESSLSKTSYGYNNDDRLETVTRNRATGEDDVWTLVHNWMAIFASVTDEDSKQIQDIRDDLSRKVKTVTPDSGTTLRLYNGNGTLASVVEPTWQGGTQTHAFTSDNLGRPLTVDTAASCGTGAPVETEFVYDAPPSGTCDSPMSCLHTAGRLAYIKTTLLCDDTAGDHTISQETWYSYDDGGRVITEYIKDDTQRSVTQSYSWSKNGALTQMTTPSTAVVGWTYGSGSDNSDQSKVAQVWRTSTSTLIGKNIQWKPFGPLSTYRHSNQISGNDLRTIISRNLAYRVTQMRVEDILGNLVFQTAVTEDARGRVTARDFSGGITGLLDSFFVYDKLDRVQCESDTTLSSCPSSPDSHTKNLHDSSPPFTSSNDWKQFRRPIPGNPNTKHVVTLVSGKDQISTVDQPCDVIPCVSAVGTTTYSYDPRGSRISDDSGTTLTHDTRSYSYDDRRNVITISGQYYVSSAWHEYTMVSAFDARNRRVFKSFLDSTTGKQAQWFFYYDPMDRLSEIRATPDTSDTSTYSVYQLFWIGNRAIHMWETDNPSGTTKRFYFHTDETTRPIETFDWPSSGNASRYWATTPDAYGNDKCLSNCASFQPLVLPGQYRDIETVAWQNDGTTQHRPSIVFNWHRSYDSFVGAYVQADPLTPTTWDAYTYASNDPVGNSDPTGLVHASWDSNGALYACDDEAQMDDSGAIAFECIMIGSFDPYEWFGGGDDGPAWDPPHEPGGGGGGDDDDDEPETCWLCPFLALPFVSGPPVAPPIAPVIPIRPNIVPAGPLEPEPDAEEGCYDRYWADLEACADQDVDGLDPAGWLQCIEFADKKLENCRQHVGASARL